MEDLSKVISLLQARIDFCDDAISFEQLSYFDKQFFLGLRAGYSRSLDLISRYL